MYALILLRHRVPVEEVLKATDEHRAYLRKLKAAGILIASGPTEPRTAGILLVRVPDDNVQQSLSELRNGDPFFKNNIANHEVLAWNPVIGKEDLDKL